MVSSMVDVKHGENVVVTDLGYPSNVFVWLPLREKGARPLTSRRRSTTRPRSSP
jgi:selenocysteine lyase/cysteine desulfurase